LLLGQLHQVSSVPQELSGTAEWGCFWSELFSFELRKLCDDLKLIAEILELKEKKIRRVLKVESGKS
jgi:hypothetical protein